MLHVALVALFFFLSGACGLIYENVWLKQISYIFGSTVTATTLVLSAFMAGLAIGSALLGSYAERFPRPLKTYGWLELGITLSAMAVGPLLDLVRVVDRRWLVPMNASPAVSGAFEFLALFAILLVPTALMGATLPILCRHTLTSLRRPGRAMGILYAINSAGGVVGGLVCGFWMMEHMGLSVSTFIAQAINAAVGIAALVMDRVLEALEDEPVAALVTEPAAAPILQAAEPAAPVVPDAHPADAPGEIPARALYVYIFLCGFTAMLFEIALMKILPLVLGSSVHSFALMVSAFIAGISVGSALAGLLVPRLERLERVLAWLLVAIGLLFLLALPLVNLLPLVYLHLRLDLALPFGAFQVITFGLCASVMLLPTIVLGGVLPVATELLTRGGASIAREVGRLYAANTLGNIAGTIVTGLVFVPALGFRTTMEIGVGVNVIAGLALAWRVRGDRTRPGLTATALAAVALYVLFYPGLDLEALSAGVFRQRLAPGLSVGDLMRSQRREVIWSDEDDVCFVTLDRFSTGTLSLRVNGKVDASTASDMRTQKLLAHLPLLFHPNPKRALVIGLGSGVTSGTALKHGLASLECAEISRAVAEAVRVFGPWNDNVHEDPRVKILVDDGRSVVERARGTWDVVISEPSNPWIAGIASLYTVEFFRTLKERLGPDGVLSQWMHIYEMDQESYQMVLRSMSNVFEHVEVFQVDSGDVIILAASRPIGKDLDAVAARMKRPGVAQDLATVGVATPIDLFGAHAVATEDVGFLAGLGQVNTDDQPLLEYRAPLSFYRRDSVRQPFPMDRAIAPGSFLRRWMKLHPPTPLERVSVANSNPHMGNSYRITLLREAVAADPSSGRLRTILAGLLAEQGDNSAALAEVRRSAPTDPKTEEAYGLMYEAAAAVEAADVSFARPRRFEISLAAARKLNELSPGTRASHDQLAAVLYNRREWAAAREHFLKALELCHTPADLAARGSYFRLMLVSCAVELGDLAEARKHFADLSMVNGAFTEGGDLFARLQAHLARDAAKGGR